MKNKNKKTPLPSSSKTSTPLARKRHKRVPFSRIALYIFLIFFAFFFLYPMVFVVINSFRPNSAIVNSPMGIFALSDWSTYSKTLSEATGEPSPSLLKLFFSNYVQAWSVMDFPFAFFNTLLITVFGVAGILLISSLAAYILSRTPSRLSYLLYIFFAFSLVIPFQIIMVPIAVLANDLHLMNTPGIILIYWGVGCPTAIFIIHGFIKSIPKELEESAAIDGAGRFYIFFNIIFPLLKTILVSVAIIDVLWIWNDFLLPLIVIREGTIQLAQMRFNGQFMIEYAPMCASLTISSIPIILFYLFLQKYIIRGIAAGAVKG